MTKILITGSGGYIGSIATYLFLQKGYEVVVIDNFSTGHEEALKYFKQKFPENFKYFQADLQKKESLKKLGIEPKSEIFIIGEK